MSAQRKKHAPDASHESPGKDVMFRVTANPDSQVSLAASFNNWDPSRHVLQGAGGVFTLTVRLPPGRHEYKFVINGVWCADLDCPDWIPNKMGSVNSVVTVE